ncbi:MAG TPA: TNT domain-containing protein [Amycolatopsis sp.]|nr:TNT domain-containing protein [Amycolatopsis sp.]
MDRTAGQPLSVTFRHAQVVDAQPPLGADETALVLRYLEREPAVLVGSGLGPDMFTGEPDVPESYHTDGTWVWHASIPHYLRKYGTPPEAEFVEHIRAREFQPPYVDKLLRRTAAADLLGRPRPKADRRDLDPTSADVAASLETRTDPDLEEPAVLVMLAQRLGEHGVWPEAYRIAARADGAWCLNATGEGWEVARYEHGEPTAPRYFERVEDAAQFLLGTLLLHPARMTAGHETPLETSAELGDWPIRPCEGEPPLTLLRNKRIVRLAAGTLVVRFGGDGGNLVHHDEARFPTTSLPIERERDEAKYRLCRPLWVIVGITVPWAGLPGGAVSYVLPKAIRDHVAEGGLKRTVGKV